jgi:hypothetical protein
MLPAIFYGAGTVKMKRKNEIIPGMPASGIPGILMCHTAACNQHTRSVYPGGCDTETDSIYFCSAQDFIVVYRHADTDRNLVYRMCFRYFGQRYIVTLFKPAELGNTRFYLRVDRFQRFFHVDTGARFPPVYPLQQ